MRRVVVTRYSIFMACCWPSAPIWQISNAPLLRIANPVPRFVEAVRALRPTGIIGASTVPKLFNQEVISAMATLNERPIIFPYSNPLRVLNVRLRRPIAGHSGEQSLQAEALFSLLRSGDEFMFPGRGTMSTFFLRWAWQFMPRKLALSPSRCLSLRRGPWPSR